MTKKHDQLLFAIKNLKFHLDGKADEGMTFTGYASVFGNVDHTNDIVAKGCFAKSLAKRMPKLCYQHDTRMVCGTIIEAVEDDYGLFVKGKLSNTQLGKDTYELLKDAAIDTMSIGYVTSESEWLEDVRVLKAVDLYEISFVTFPANERAKVTNVKSAPSTIRDFEERLRDAGFTRKQSEIIAKNSFKALQGDPEEEGQGEPEPEAEKKKAEAQAEAKKADEVKVTKDAINNLLTQFKGK